MPLSQKDLALLKAHAQAADDRDLAPASMQWFEVRGNREPLDDFAGLSPDQMTSFLYAAFNSPDLIELPDVLPSQPSAPILDLLLPLFELLTEKPIKLTAKGNLPTAFVKAMAAAYAPTHDPYYEFHREYVHNEDSFSALHVAKVVADLAGLVYKKHGKLHLTKLGARLLDDQGAAGVYPVLLRTYAGKYNWGYTDRYDELPIIQQSWAFTCYLLQKYGHEPRPEEFYADLFLRAFPAAAEEVTPFPYSTPEDTVRRSYMWRALVRFLGFFGLARYSWKYPTRASPAGNLMATPLLADAVRLHVP